MTGFPKLSRLVSILPLLLLAAGSCAYFNTYYNARSYFREGMKELDQGRPIPAKAKFERAIEKSALVISRWPKSRWVDDATFLVGMSYYHMGQYPKAVRHLEQLVLAFPDSPFVPEAELHRGLALLGNHEYGVARIVLDEVRRKYTRLSDDAAFHSARSFHRREQYDRAIDSLRAFVSNFPRSEHVRPAVRILAESCYRLERWQQAEAWYERLVQLHNDPKQRTEARLRVAACRLSQGKHEEAARQANEVLGRYADLEDEANLILGRALDALGREADALAAWRRVRGNNEFGAEAFFRIGKYHEELRDFETARAHYDTARDRRANSDFGVLAVKRLSLLDAFAQKEGSEDDPAKAAFLLAEVNNLNLEDYDRAVELYQSVYDSYPDSKWAPKALFAKAWIIRNVMDDSAGSVGWLSKLIDEYPDTEYADESRRWLGLPVPERAPRVEEPEPESTAVVPVGPEKPESPDEQELPEGDMPERGPEWIDRPPDDYPPGTLPDEQLPPHIRERRRRRPPDEPIQSPGKPEVPRPDSSVPAHEPEQAAKPEGPVTAETDLQKVDEATGTTLTLAERPSSGEPTDAPAPATIGERTEELRLEIIHFAFDRSDIRPEDTETLRRNADRLVQSGLAITVVGHCDPRGSDEYNMALGRLRAEAVAAFLVESGVESSRIAARSEGENQLVSTGPDEYWLDRRVVFEIGN
ncbi:MAG: tetratricopeptide repeat protein [candidate division WOR-3 bacterium]|nr:MAG: tetratricopeptide repeat protein [candidate division WOR-3 bacterium]